MEPKRAPVSVDAYLASFPPAVRAKLERLRAAIREAAPEAVEKISYQIPTFAWHGNLVHFAAYERHLGFYPGFAALLAFRRELAGFKKGKGSVQFALSGEPPYALVSRIVRFRVALNARRFAQRKKQKRA